MEPMHVPDTTSYRIVSAPADHVGLPPRRKAVDASRLRSSLLAGVLLAAVAPAQVVTFGVPNPGSGSLNAQPWGIATGATSLHTYRAADLRSWGLCVGAQLVDLAVAAATSGSGVYLAPSCTLAVGHLRVDPPVPGAWTTHLDSPAIVHDLASGPFTFAWTEGVWNPLPGVAAAGFVWDGQRDIGVLLSTSPGTLGTFPSGTSSGLRHFAGVFGATTQSPFVLSGYAMAARLSFVPSAACASRTSVGVGCYDGAYSFHQQFSRQSDFDLGGSAASPRTLLATPIPAGYRVANGASAWRPPAGTPVLDNRVVPGPMEDDSLSRPLQLPFSFPFPGGSTTVVHAAADGYVLLGATADIEGTPTPNTALLGSGLARLAPMWCDLDPTMNVSVSPASGVYFDVDPTNGTAYVTWLDVGIGSFFMPGQSSIHVQCVLHADGSYEYRYGAVVITPFTQIDPVLVGWSQGGSLGTSANLHGSIDLSAALPFATDGPDSRRLWLESDLPILGANLALTALDVQSPSPLAFFAFGDTQVPGTDLGYLGAPGCFSYSNANLLCIAAPVTFVGGAGTSTRNVALPNAPVLIGVLLVAQAIAFTRNNALQLATSNGLSLLLGR